MTIEDEKVISEPGLRDLQREIHATAVEKGWWDEGDRNVGEVLALIHSEVSEALEAWREHEFLTWRDKERGGKIEGFWTELGDAVIRILDYAEYHNEDMQLIILNKMAYNKTRSYKHGGKRA